MPATTCRRWYRIRLRTLLFVIAVLALPMAWIAKERGQSRSELQITDQLQALDGTELGLGSPYDYDIIEDGDASSRWRDLARSIVGDRIVFVANYSPEFRDLAKLNHLTNLRGLIVASNQVDDLTPLAGLVTLRSLTVGSQAISDLGPLARCKELENLQIAGTRVSDLTPIAQCRRIQALWIGGTPISDLAPLAGFKQLQSLDAQRLRSAIFRHSRVCTN